MNTLLSFFLQVVCAYPLPRALDLRLVYTGLPAHEVVLADLQTFWCNGTIPVVVGLDVLANRSAYVLRADLGRGLGVASAGPFSILQPATLAPPPPSGSGEGNVTGSGTNVGPSPGAGASTGAGQEQAAAGEMAAEGSGDSTAMIAVTCVVLPVAVSLAVLFVLRARRRKPARHEPQEDILSMRLSPGTARLLGGRVSDNTATRVVPPPVSAKAPREEAGRPPASGRPPPPPPPLPKRWACRRNLWQASSLRPVHQGAAPQQVASPVLHCFRRFGVLPQATVPPSPPTPVPPQQVTVGVMVTVPLLWLQRRQRGTEAGESLQGLGPLSTRVRPQRRVEPSPFASARVCQQYKGNRRRLTSGGHTSESPK